MDSILFSLIVLGLISILSAIGLLVDKISNNRDKHTFLLVALKNFVTNNYHWILIYFFCFTLVLSGLQNIFSHFEFNEESVFMSSYMISIFLVSFAFYYFHKIIKRNKQYPYVSE